jgi:hypothetical protein
MLKSKPQLNVKAIKRKEVLGTDTPKKKNITLVPKEA